MKAANSYASLLRGVSQQVPQDRADGQHTEQVNMLADPVNGLTRRHGSLWQAEALSSYVAASDNEDISNWKSYDFTQLGKEYTLLYRSKAKVSGATTNGLVVYNKTDKVFLTTSLNGTTINTAGTAAITSVGRYLFLAANNDVVAGSSVNTWDNSANHAKGVVWVRGGAYSRTYKVTYTNQSGTVTTVSYTTPASSYGGVLDTSDIPFAADDYTKQVNDRVNAYNSAVTAWIGTSTAAIQPSAIAASLMALMVSAGGGYSFTRIGSHICFGTGLVRAIEVDDGGDGSFIRAVGDEIISADATSVIHSVGKVVKVRPKDSQEAFYLQAYAKNGIATGYTEVTWREAPGVTHTVTQPLYYGAVSGSTFYVSKDTAWISTAIGATAPSMSPSVAGDADSSPMPYFVGQNITYLGTFQSRLLIGSGGVLAVSETNEYLNFFRTTVLTLPASDAFELIPQGSENDELTSSVLYDQDLVVFGTKRQYVISGNAALTPTSAKMAVMTTFESVVDANPISVGGYIFYSKQGTVSSDVFQIQPGKNDKSPEAFPASSQLVDYFQGGITELASMTGSPNYLFARTKGNPTGLYTFAYLDKQDGRKMDAWSRWQFNAALGVVVGMSVIKTGVLVFSARAKGAQGYWVADLCSLTTAVSDQPYLDSLRAVSYLTVPTHSVDASSGSNWAVAFDAENLRRFTGTLLPNLTTFNTNYPDSTGLKVGAVQEAYFVPTNPFMRDGKDKAILSGRLTVTKFITAFKESTGFKWLLSYRNVVDTEVEFNGRVLGDPENLIGIEPISTGQHNIPVGRETRKYELTVSARRWYPLTVTALEWVGQFFNRVQRF